MYCDRGAAFCGGHSFLPYGSLEIVSLPLSSSKTKIVSESVGDLDMFNRIFLNIFPLFSLHGVSLGFLDSFRHDESSSLL